jgi:hypothetical protein
MGGFDENIVGTTIVASNGDSFVQEPVKMFDTNCFVVAASSNMDVDVQDGADFLETAFEGATIIHNN